MNDHDLLIEIKAKVDRVIIDVASLSSNLVGKVEALEFGKADKKDVDKCTQACIEKTDSLHNRIEKLENWRWYIIGIGSIVVIVIDYLIRRL